MSNPWKDYKPERSTRSRHEQDRKDSPTPVVSVQGWSVHRHGSRGFVGTVKLEVEMGPEHTEFESREIMRRLSTRLRDQLGRGVF